MTTIATRVLLVDDDEDLRHAHLQTLRLAEAPARGFAGGEDALRHIDRAFAGVVVTDVRMPGMDGLAFASRIREIDPDLPVILMTGHGDIDMAVGALKNGAFDFLVKPFAAERLVTAVRHALRQRDLVLENRRLSELVARGDGGLDHSGLLGQSPAMAHVRSIIGAVAGGDVDVLILGDSGVGKEVAARALHRQSRRARKPFVVVNCAALSEAALDGELFGRAAPGSANGRRLGGRIREAAGGTLMVDEIDALPPPLQARLLRLIEDGELTQEGGDSEAADVRVVATSRIAVEEAVAAGRFRPDLYYRLSAVSVRLPPLRERGDDVELLFRHFLVAGAARQRITPPPVTAQVLEHLVAHDWPGNVRELALYAERRLLGLDADAGPDIGADRPLPERVAAFEARALATALIQAAGDATQARARLGLPRKTFYDKIKRHGLDLRAFRGKDRAKT